MRVLGLEKLCLLERDLGMDELADYEKMIENINLFAKLLRAYYEAMIENGFSEKDALYLTSEYQRSVLGIGKLK